MPDLWLPGVARVPASRSWTMDGGSARYANWHSTENDRSARAIDLAHYLVGIRAEPHFVWNPWGGELVQLLPANVGGSVLVTGNHRGGVNIGVECIGRAGVEGHRPLYDSPMIGFDRILGFMRSWGIPDAWPAGAPLPYPQSAGLGNPQRARFGASGHYGHSQWPGNDHGDPGVTHVERWGAPASAPQPPAAPLGALPIAVDGSPGAQTWAALQRAVGAAVDGLPGPETWRHVQARVGVPADGVPGPVTWRAVQRHVGVPADGVPGPVTWRAVQAALNARRF